MGKVRDFFKRYFCFHRETDTRRETVFNYSRNGRDHYNIIVVTYCTRCGAELSYGWVGRTSFKAKQREEQE